MESLTYYSGQSPITDPRARVDLLSELPGDPAGLSRIVQGLLIHYEEGDLFSIRIPTQRLRELNLRWVSAMLTRIAELDERPLAEPRPASKRLVGCCRDFATLFCALARHVGIPARTRVGFSAYFAANFNHDHEVVECWDPHEGRWRLIDPQMTPLHVELYNMQFSPLDLPRDQFLVGGLAWQRCRSGVATPERFGVSPRGDLKGWWFLRHKLIQDLAAENKMELLLWDTWGLMEIEPTSSDLALLDEVAEITQGGTATFARLRELYERTTGLRVPASIRSHSPVSRPSQVKIAPLP